MTAVNIPGGIWLGLLAAAFLAELILSMTVFRRMPHRTGSGVFRGWTLAGFALPFGWGVLAGHFFHPFADWPGVLGGSDAMVRVAVAAGPIAVLALVDTIVALATRDFQWPGWVGPVALAAGVLVGALVWPV